jgi:hypothetical protein
MMHNPPDAWSCSYVGGFGRQRLPWGSRHDQLADPGEDKTPRVQNDTTFEGATARMLIAPQVSSAFSQHCCTPRPVCEPCTSIICPDV